MNPLTLVKRIQSINSKEASLGISEDASWHAKYKDSAYVFVGGIPFDLTEGDLAVFAQLGEIVDVNLVRDKGTGKSKGFAFIANEDQRSTNLAVDNLNGAQVLGRIIRVDHVNKYKKKEEEDEETERQKREARGFSHDEQVRLLVLDLSIIGHFTSFLALITSGDLVKRAANTGWGPDDKNSRWGLGFAVSTKIEKGSGTSNRISDSTAPEAHRSSDKDARNQENPLEGKEKRMDHKEGYGKLAATEKRPWGRDADPNSREDRDRREVKRSRRHEAESYDEDDINTKGKDTVRSL
ncbi:hypothetical protein U1Q18_035513 [Sarracenia purpurea var. burkii]